MVTLVQALWGDVLVSEWPQVLRDIQDIHLRRDDFAKGMTRMTFSYGQQNSDFLNLFGYDNTLLSSETIVDFMKTGNREHRGRGAKGVFNYGGSIWMHKVHAIQTAFEIGADEILWCDWDLRRLSDDCTVLENLKNGPAFQGRLQRRKSRNASGKMRHVYQGGCYYIRSRDLVNSMWQIYMRAPYLSDEAVIRIAVENVFMDGRYTNIEVHRDLGYDNPALFLARQCALPGPRTPVFAEGRRFFTPGFASSWTDPPDEFANHRRLRKRTKRHNSATLGDTA